MKTVKVKSIKKVATPELVCDIGVEDNHNLFVCDSPGDSPVLVHNCWSLTTKDENIASVFEVGRLLRAKFKLMPTPELADRIDKEGDVHKLNAAYFFGVDIQEVTKVIRQAVKQVIFGLIYQQGDKGLSESTNQTVDAIRKLKKQFLSRFPKGVAWFEEIKAFARKNLYVESPVGRRRHLWQFLLPKATPNAESALAKAERLSVNSPIQGLGSDYLVQGSRCVEVLKWKHYKATNHYPDFYQTNSVHDSIEFSCAYSDFWLAVNIIDRGLTSEVIKVNKERHGFDFTIPLEIDFEIGPNGRDSTGWNYDIRALGKIIMDTLTKQKEELGHTELDVEKVYSDIMEGQYKDMPDWAQKQCWNLRLNLKGMRKDPRNSRLQAA